MRFTGCTGLTHVLQCSSTRLCNSRRDSGRVISSLCLVTLIREGLVNETFDQWTDTQQCKPSGLLLVTGRRGLRTVLTERSYNGQVHSRRGRSYLVSLLQLEWKAYFFSGIGKGVIGSSPLP